jgi:hypothetical protein
VESAGPQILADARQTGNDVSAQNELLDTPGNGPAAAVRKLLEPRERDRRDVAPLGCRQRIAPPMNRTVVVRHGVDRGTTSRLSWMCSA